MNGMDGVEFQAVPFNLIPVRNLIPSGDFFTRRPGVKMAGRNGISCMNRIVHPDDPGMAFPDFSALLALVVSSEPFRRSLRSCGAKAPSFRARRDRIYQKLMRTYRRLPC